jgi:UDP-N-acetylmuramate--alanine ligase
LPPDFSNLAGGVSAVKLTSYRAIHFVGVGGAGVSGLARIALQAGVRVSGSDLCANHQTKELAEGGAQVALGHDAAHLQADCALVVASAAVRSENPEIAEARRRGLRVMKYAEALGELTRGYRSLCVAGTHGKTTATAMLAQILREDGRDPGWLVGGEPASLPAASAAGGGGHFVVESCEYDRTFLRLYPNLILLNNIELDHMDVYGDLDGMVRGFIEFAHRLPEQGTLIFNADDPQCRRVAEVAPCRAVGFGAGEHAHWRMRGLDVADGFARAAVTCGDMPVGHLRLEVPGAVNAYNALGALAAANWAGVPVARALSALRNFRGVKRRFEVMGSVGGVPLVDDYAHHPTAVNHLMETARATFMGRRLVVVFQAHQYQRILTFHEGFVSALAAADRVIVARTYAARESGITPGEPEERLAGALRERGLDACSRADFPAILNDLSLSTTPRDVLLFVGAGDIHRVAEEMLARREIISTRLRAIAAGELAIEAAA